MTYIYLAFLLGTVAGWLWAALQHGDKMRSINQRIAELERTAEQHIFRLREVNSEVDRLQTAVTKARTPFGL